MRSVIAIGVLLGLGVYVTAETQLAGGVEEFLDYLFVGGLLAVPLFWRSGGS